MTLATFGTTSYRSGDGSYDVSAKRYRYTGKERDEETGLDYHGLRYKASWLGRWSTADPLGLVDGPNLYGYVSGSPIVLSDPTGAQQTIEEHLLSLDEETPPPDEGAAGQLRTFLSRAEEKLVAAARGAVDEALETLFSEEEPQSSGKNQRGLPSSGFNTPWEAARAALSIYNPLSIESKDPNDRLDTGVEYGGLIFKRDGKFFFTEAVSGEEKGAVDVWRALESVPEDSRSSIVGDFHTHGGAGPFVSGEDFSGLEHRGIVRDMGNGMSLIEPPAVTSEQEEGGDIASTRADLTSRRENILDPETYTAFLGTPKGRFALFIPSKNLVFHTSPDRRLLPKGQVPPASAHAK